MEIVIKLTKEDFKKVQDGRSPVTVMRNAIRNGKVLPKGHGRLVDEDDVLNNPDGIYYDLCDVPSYMEHHISTVVEADKEVDE